MTQSNTRFIGMDVHQETIAVADVAQDRGAEVTCLGPIGPRRYASDLRIRTRQAQATHLMVVDEAGPCGYWLYRSLV